MNSRELPFQEIDGSSFFVLPKGAAGMGDPAGAGDVVPRDEVSSLWPGGGTTSNSCGYKKERIDDKLASSPFRRQF